MRAQYVAPYVEACCQPDGMYALVTLDYPQAEAAGAALLALY